MILFKACPRCGGDVDATYHDDARCVQCAYRPTVVFPGPRVIEAFRGSAGSDQASEGAREREGERRLDANDMCPKCGSERLVKLDRLRPGDNFCYRCLTCGHIFSPCTSEPQTRPDQALR